MIGLQREIHRWQPDIILCEEEPWSFARWQARIGSWLSKKRPLFVEFTWENLPRQGLKGKFLRRVYRLAVSTTDGVVCGNRGSERMFMEAGLPAWRCLRTGQLGIDPAEHPIPTTSEKAAWRNRLGFPQDAFVAGFCGRFVEEKGILDLLEAIEQLREQGLDLFLVYLGAGPLEAELKSRTRDAAWFQILPPVAHAQVPEIICHFDLFVLPSKPQLDPSKGIWEEQFGHVLIEAMMSAVPCIGSDSGGIPEVLEDPEVLFPPGNIHELIRLIRQLATHPDQRAALGKAQREATLRRWTHEALAERYSKFILHLLSPT